MKQDKPKEQAGEPKWKYTCGNCGEPMREEDEECSYCGFPAGGFWRYSDES